MANTHTVRKITSESCASRPCCHLVRITSTWSLGRMSLPTPVSSLMHMETARMPGGRSCGQYTAFASFDELDGRDGRQHRRARDRASQVLDGVRPTTALDATGAKRALRPVLPA